MSSQIPNTVGAASYLLGDLTVSPALGEVEGADGKIRIEPKMMELLDCLCSAPGEVVSHRQLEAALWGKDFIADDAVARLVSKLRKALGDQATNPRYIETIPKRGYRVIALVEVTNRTEKPLGKTISYSAIKLGLAALAVLVVGSTLAMMVKNQPREDLATYYYSRFTPDGASQSAALFRRSIDRRSSDLTARVGLANALVQTVLLVDEFEKSGLTASWRDQRHLVPANQEVLDEALWHAEYALTLRPRDAEATKARAMALSALGQFDAAAAAYEQTLEIDPMHWGAMLNLAEVRFLQGDQAEQSELFEKAFIIMQDTIADDHDIMTRWGAPLATHIAYNHLSNGNNKRAMDLFQSALKYRPVYEDASRGLRLAQKSNDQPVQ